MVLLLGGVAAAVYRWRNTNQEAEHGSAEEPHLVGFADVISTISAEGKIVGNDLVDVSFDTTGKLTQVAVKAGDIINAGDLLARVDNTQHLNNVKRAQN